MAYMLKCWPLPRWWLLAVALGMALCSGLATWDLMGAEFPVWAETSFALHERLWLPGVALVGASAAMALVFNAHGQALNNGMRPRDGAHVYLAHCGLLSMAALVGYMLGFIPAMLWTMRGASWGHINLFDTLIAACGVVLLVCAGYACGRIFHHIIVVPLVMALAFMLMAITVEPLARPWGLIVPVRGIQTTARFETNPATAMFSAVALVALVSFLPPRCRALLARCAEGKSYRHSFPGPWAAAC